MAAETRAQIKDGIVWDIQVGVTDHCLIGFDESCLFLAISMWKIPVLRHQKKPNNNVFYYHVCSAKRKPCNLNTQVLV